MFLSLLLSIFCIVLSLTHIHAETVRYPQLYEISTRPWLYALSQQYGRNMTLKDVPDSEFLALKKQGIDIVWMMGVWTIGEYGLQHDRTNPGLLEFYPKVMQGFTLDDVIGSPYAIVDYTMNPELGTDSDLLDLKIKLNNMGLQLMLDFVPNHSAVDCPWTSIDPSFYIRAPHTVPPYDSSRYLSNGIAYGYSGWGNAWTDTAQLNYWNMDLRNTMAEQLMKVASYSDYIRCDMAYLVLNDVIKQLWPQEMSYWGFTEPATEFWAEAIAQVKDNYDVKFLAEVYNEWAPKIQEVGFDYTYDKHLYDHLGTGNLDDIRHYISSTPLEYHEHAAHFVENHDEPRAATFFGTNARADAASAVVMTLPGMRFYFDGQERGYFNKLEVHLRRGAPEPSNVGVNKFYDALRLVLSKPIFNLGTWTYRTLDGSDASGLLAWEWEYESEKILVVINYSDSQGSDSIVCSKVQPVNDDIVHVTELLTGTIYPQSALKMSSTGLEVEVGPWSVQMFQYF